VVFDAFRRVWKKKPSLTHLSAFRVVGRPTVDISTGMRNSSSVRASGRSVRKLKICTMLVASYSWETYKGTPEPSFYSKTLFEFKLTSQALERTRKKARGKKGSDGKSGGQRNRNGTRFSTPAQRKKDRGEGRDPRKGKAHVEGTCGDGGVNRGNRQRKSGTQLNLQIMWGSLIDPRDTLRKGENKWVGGSASYKLDQGEGRRGTGKWMRTL